MERKKTETEKRLESWSNKIEFFLKSRSLDCYLGQENGKPTPDLELVFQGEINTRPLKKKFNKAEIFLILHTEPYEVRSDGEIVQGFIRGHEEEQLLEARIGVGEQQFLSLLSMGNESETYAAIWPFESVEEWDGKTTLLIREAQFKGKRIIQNNK